MEDITVSELKERLDRGEKFHFIDVREAHQLSQLEKIKEEEIVIHCRSGARSGNAKKFMETNGFTQVRNVLGGILAFRALPE